MKILLFTFLLLGAAPVSFAQCETSVSTSSDTIGSVKRKLNCLVEENQKLKDEVAKLRQGPAKTAAPLPLVEENQKLKDEVAKLRQGPAKTAAPLPRTLIASGVGGWFKRDTFSIDTCKAAAVKAVVSRGGVVVAQDKRSIDLELDGHAIMIQCSTIDNDLAIVSKKAKKYIEEDDFGSLIVTGPVQSQNADLFDLLRINIFPQ